MSEYVYFKKDEDMYMFDVAKCNFFHKPKDKWRYDDIAWNRKYTHVDLLVCREFKVAKRKLKLENYGTG